MMKYKLLSKLLKSHWLMSPCIIIKVEGSCPESLRSNVEGLCPESFALNVEGLCPESYYSKCWGFMPWLVPHAYWSRCRCIRQVLLSLLMHCRRRRVVYDFISG